MSEKKILEYAGNIFDEIKENQYGGNAEYFEPYGWSTDLGNQGRVCTLTKECMASCNL